MTQTAASALVTVVLLLVLANISHADMAKYPDGRTCFTLSCDGWVQKFDTRSLQVVGRARPAFYPLSDP